MAFVLIQTALGKAMDVSARIMHTGGVKSAYTVTGPYDVIAVIEAEDFTEMGDIVTSKISHIPGVERCIVCAEASGNIGSEISANSPR